MYNKRGLKGQAEIIIIVGLVVVSVIAVFFASQAFVSRPEPAGIANLKALLKADVERQIESIAIKSVSLVGKQGGYLDVTGNFVDFRGGKVPYWGICENKFIPSLEQATNNIKIGIENKINNLDFSEIKKKYGKEIKIDKVTRADIDVLVRERDVLVDVQMPTSLEGFQIEQPYKITVLIPLGRMHNFASDFVEDYSRERHFDRFIASLFYHAKTEKLPTLDLLGKCGESIFITDEEAHGTVGKIVDFAARNTYLWSQPPPEESREYLDYYIPSVNNRTYPDLEVEFLRAGDVTSKNFQPSEPLFFVNSKPLHELVSECIEPVNVRYSLDIPIITSVKSGGHEFNFATKVAIEDSQIANCDVEANITEIQDPCADLQCEAKVTVVDSPGKPVPNTKVSFGQCFLGLTGEDGFVQGRAPCGVAELGVYNPEYNFYRDLVSTANFERKIVLTKTPAITLRFSDISINDGFQSLSVKPDSVKNTIVIFKPKNSSPWSSREIFTTNIESDSGLIKNETAERPVYDKLLPDTYLIEANMTLNYTDGKKESSIADFEIPLKNSGATPKELNFNVNNNYNQNINQVEILLAKSIPVIPDSNKTTVSSPAFFSKTDFSAGTLRLLWSSKNGLLKPGESGKFSVLLFSGDLVEINKPATTQDNAAVIDDFLKTHGNLQEDIRGTVSGDIASRIKSRAPNVYVVDKGLPIKLTNLVPPGLYEVEVRQQKTVLMSESYCRGVHWHGGCKGYTSINVNITAFGITTSDFEVKESDKELYISGFSPHFNITSAGGNSTFYYNDVLDKIKNKCGIQPIGRAGIENLTCSFGGQ